MLLMTFPSTEQVSIGIGQNQKAISKFTQLIGLLQKGTPADVQNVLNELLNIRQKLEEETYTCTGFE